MACSYEKAFNAGCLPIAIDQGIALVKWISLGWCAVFGMIIVQVYFAKFVHRRIIASEKFHQKFPDVQYVTCGDEIQVQMQQL